MDNKTIFKEKDISVEWTVLENQIEFILHAKTTGWIAIGFEPERMMKGADIIIAYVKDGKLFIEDHYAHGLTSHKSDVSLKGTDDVTGIEGVEESGSTTIKFRIPLNSSDRFDKKLKTGVKYKVILAHGKKDNFRSIHSFRTSTELKF
jgi:hypothetical protein